MKLAGLTWWRNNYGSILQAYALQKKINSIDGVTYEIINQYGKKITSVDNFMDKVKAIGIKKTLQRAFWKFGVRKLRRRSQNIQNFVDKHLKVSQNQYSEYTLQQANKEYDGFFCGSDQIWNPTMEKIGSMYWLGFSEDSKMRIAYAPSIGVDRISKESQAIIRKTLSRFTAVSCREENGTKLINNILGEEKCITVLDPTLMVEKNVWDQLCSERKYEEPYIFVYMLRGTKEQRKMIEAFAKEKKLKIVTMPFMETEYTVWYDLKFGDIKYWDAAPDEFVSVIRYAKWVFTDSFHSMIFSCIYHIPFFTFPKLGKAQMDRITGLQELLEIDSRMINDYTDIKRVLSKKIDWRRVDEIIDRRRKISQKYLYDSIEKGRMEE
jgi:hypothetical protein